MGSTVDDVHHGDRQNVCRQPTDVTVKRNAQLIGSRPGNSHGDPEDRVCAQVALILGTVQLDHHLVHLGLCQRLVGDKGRCDAIVDSFYSLCDSLTQVTLLVAVPHLQGFALTG